MGAIDERYFRIKKAAEWDNDTQVANNMINKLMEQRASCARAILSSEDKAHIERLNRLFDEYERMIKLILGLE